MKFLFQSTYFGLLSLIFALVLSCGKKAEEKNNTSAQSQPQQTSELEAQLNQQELFCASDRSCPNYIAKVAVLYKGKLKFCTGFITDENVIATASSCLPERLRSKDLPCDKDVFFFFAQTNEKPKRVACKKVVEVSQIDAKEPFLWRNDLAYLEYEEIKPSERRRVVTPSRSGMSDLDHFYLWTVDQIDDLQGIIRKSEDCQSVHNSYFNPLANSEFSPVMTLAGCEYETGNSGAPIFDYRGKVRGVVSMPVETKYVEEVMSMRVLGKPLKKMMHVSNYACAPTVPQQEVANENECGKILDYTSYDQARREMINESNLFKSAVQRIETATNNKTRYLQMKAKLTAVGDDYLVEMQPTCFKNVSSWIGEFNSSRAFTFNIELPDIRLRSSMNEYGRIIALEFVRQNIPTNFQFKPSILRSNRQTTVYMWAEGPTTNFPNLSEKCESLF